jgi:hypothetical protein
MITGARLTRTLVGPFVIHVHTHRDQTDLPLAQMTAFA